MKYGCLVHSKFDPQCDGCLEVMRGYSEQIEKTEQTAKPAAVNCMDWLCVDCGQTIKKGEVCKNTIFCETRPNLNKTRELIVDVCDYFSSGDKKKTYQYLMALKGVVWLMALKFEDS